ncbi:iron uptake porin [Cyanobium sp. LEGE 06113]|uniref:iron uptake porin n=1 Tax=Cyanobium sp. LEGE 06113 TaxID=1297573 RepID=UPI00187F79DB|nr:iron uptake porin [Cyanobium sp. LEGE 06113]MBE9152815.1 carbohydrate porin [Cyanobium sp. LEGE 06113]MBE9152980.1 carbohydrate porin [Cyanobium sp. LEGE 06113]
MHLFQQLLVAPAALGLLAPVAATAAELNFDGVDRYASQEQVTSISQFSDVQPTDWAYQALSNLIERYGCVAGYPDGTYRGQRAMTRFEAAALLNACLDRVTEVTDELKRLMAEFEKELAILKGRVDGLEAKVGELEASQFSTTTKLSGQATMVLGGAGNTGFGDNITANYDVQLSFDTSFSGKDLLRTTLRAGNFGSSVFGNGNTALGISFGEEDSADSVFIDRLFYQFPIGENFIATVGANVAQDDIVLWPTAYPVDMGLDIFNYAGAQATYNKTQGAGAGLQWQKEGWAFTMAYVSDIGAASDSTVGAGRDFIVTAQGGYIGENWGGAIAYTYSDYDPFELFPTSASNNVAVSGYWQPKEAGWVPSISAGFGWSDIDRRSNDEAWSWMVGLTWDDMFIKGNSLGMALGSVGVVDGGKCGTVGTCSNSLWVDGGDGNDNLAYELWYNWQVTDNIAVTPAFFYIENTGTDDTFGGMLKTTFSF